MEISGKILREVEFRDRLRGYDTDEVDEFLEHVAVALDELLAEHAVLRQRAELAERQLQEAPPLDDDGIRRTLVLAQRTADLALREARAEAEQVLGEARARAEAVLGEAEDDAARLREEADRDVRVRAVQVTEQHERLTREIRILGALLESERTRITQSLTDALRFVGDSMGVSDEVAAALGGRGEVPGTGDGAEGASAEPRAAHPAPPAGQAEARSGEPRADRRSLGYPEHGPEGRPPSGPGGQVSTGQPAGVPPPSRPAPPGTAPAVSSEGAPSSGAPSPPARSVQAAHGANASPPATPPSGSGRLSDVSSSSSSSSTAGVGSASRRANAVSNGSGRAERDIEAELLEDAGLTRGARAPWDQASASPTGRGAAPGAGVTGDTPDPADDDALWSRWHRTGGGTLDPLSDPPPTQAYRLEPDGGWSA